MKQNLISIVQSILSDMDSENVNTINDSVEAQQIARVVKDTYYNLIATRDIPEHEELIKLTAASDNEFPTHFRYPDNCKEIVKVWYTGSDGFYHEVNYIQPLDFLSLTDKTNDEETITVLDKNAGTTLRIRTDKTPDFYTAFDDEWIVMNSFDRVEDATLQESKVRAYGTVYPTFEMTDFYVPDLDNTMFPYLIAEAKSTAMSLFKGGSDPKIEQSARRQKSYMQNDMYKTKQANKRNNYGRR